jgi:hypothetical protein
MPRNADNPNILVIFGDDIGTANLSSTAATRVHRHENAKTPFDELRAGACDEPVERCFRDFVARPKSKSL